MGKNCNFAIHERRETRKTYLLFIILSLWRKRVATCSGGMRRRGKRRLHEGRRSGGGLRRRRSRSGDGGGRRRRRRGRRRRQRLLLLIVLLLLLLLREARRRRREAPPGSKVVPHGRLLECSSGGGAELIGVSVGRGLLLLLGTHLDTVAAVCRARARRRGSSSQRGDHPPVELRVEHGERREDGGLEPREGDDGPSSAGLGEAVFVWKLF